MELALLHPSSQKMYTYLTGYTDFSKAKSIVRFIANVLQFDLYNFFSFNLCNGILFST